MKNKNWKKTRRTNRARDAARIYSKRQKTFELSGVFVSSSKGGLFFETGSDGKPSEDRFYVDFDNTMGAMNGDQVIAKVRLGDRSAVITDITVRSVKTVVGTIVLDERYQPPYYLEPDDSKYRFDFAVVGMPDGMICSDGDKAELAVTRYPDHADDQPEGVLTRIFGQADTVGANYEAILHQSGVTIDFSPEAVHEAEIASTGAIEASDRLDLRDELIITIDGADAKDLDDAISVKRRDAGYILGVHIADVSHYVRAGGALDRDAFERGTSVYFTDKVVPMLPVALSNGACSLNSGVDRYALSAFVYVDKFGEIEKCELSKTVICSAVRGVYSEVNSLISGDADDNIMNKYSCILGEPLNCMLELYRLLRKKNERRGALELDSEESLILLDKNGDPIDIVPRERGEAERLIEQFMLCANEAVARWLSEHGYPCVFRVHEPPEKERCIDFIRFAQALGLDPGYIKPERITPAYFGNILAKAKKKGLGSPVSYMLLRTMSKAKYSERNSGHFGLASLCYCHFTSPIRRYPDLAVHRIISFALENGVSSEVCAEFDGFAASAAKRSSENELKAMEAEREIEDLYKCIFMKKLVGCELDARVSSVTSFGLFCTTDKTCEGLVPITSMRDRYRFDKETLTLSSYSRTYRLGDKVRVRVESVDISSRQVDFSLIDELTDGDERYGGHYVRRRPYRGR